ncbi:hypothetical protein HYT84_00170 [Candidatus Micrarchaeota archaeon]|nr:hypothetical protein [Candidatus Micrarchaeota archaeon]
MGKLVRRILEIGHGGNPIGTSGPRHLSELLPPDARYYGIDHPSKPDLTFYADLAVFFLEIRITESI